MHEHDDPSVRIERVDAVTAELRAALDRLLPQLAAELATPADAELRNILAQPGLVLFVARASGAGTAPGDAGRIIGTLTLVTHRLLNGVRTHVEDVVVDEEARGMGVGELLLETAVRHAEQEGAHTVALTSHPDRTAANRLYQQAGFELRDTNAYVRHLRPPG